MSLLVTLIAMHANRYDKQGNERLLEQRAHCDSGPESPFTLPSEDGNCTGQHPVKAQDKKQKDKTSYGQDQ